MIGTLPDDLIEITCTYLDALSGLSLASTAKPILVQARRLQVCARADAAAGRIQRAFRRFYWWPSTLRAMASTLKPEAVAFAAQRAKAAILDRFEGLVQSENLYHVRAAAKQMMTLLTILHGVSAQTLQPGKLLDAAACVEELIDVIVKHGGLKACALAFAALHRWGCVEPEWHSLAETMYQHSGSLEEEAAHLAAHSDDEKCIVHADPDEMLARLSDPARVDCPRVRGLFQAMREERNVALGLLRTSEPQANELAMQAARAFIETEQP